MQKLTRFLGDLVKEDSCLQKNFESGISTQEILTVANEAGIEANQIYLSETPCTAVDRYEALCLARFNYVRVKEMIACGAP